MLLPTLCFKKEEDNIINVSVWNWGNVAIYSPYDLSLIFFLQFFPIPKCRILNLQLSFQSIQRGALSYPKSFSILSYRTNEWETARERTNNTNWNLFSLMNALTIFHNATYPILIHLHAHTLTSYFNSSLNLFHITLRAWNFTKHKTCRVFTAALIQNVQLGIMTESHVVHQTNLQLHDKLNSFWGQSRMSFDAHLLLC